MGDRPILLEDVIAPLGRDQFVSQYWTKSHLHLSGEKGRFNSLLSWEDLNHILEWHSPSPYRLKLFQDGQQIDPQSYIEGTGGGARLNVGCLIARLSQGASLVMDDVQEIVPRIRELAGTLQDIFHAPVVVNLYAGWGRNRAFNLHWDPQEVFILQLSGRKHWQIFGPTRSSPLKDDPGQPPEPVGHPVWQGDLQDGDMLYMPRGWWHAVTPLDEPSLHLNFAIELPNGADFLNWWLPKLLNKLDIRRNLPLDRDAMLQDDYFPGLLEMMADDGRAHDRPGEFLREWNAYKRAHPPIQLPLAPVEQKKPIGMATRVRLAQRDRLFIECEHDSSVAHFKAVGRQYKVAPQIAAALQRLSGHDSLAVGQLCEELHNANERAVLIDALETLASEGVILKAVP